MKSAVTVSLVPEARGGPFVYHGDLPAACREAKALGFDAVELFPPGPGVGDVAEIDTVLRDHGLALAAVGTGAGWVKHKLTLTDPDPAVRTKAREFLRGIVGDAGALGCYAIVGSMQGRWGGEVSRETALGWLADALAEAAEYALTFGNYVLIEPLNRYETNLINTLDDGVELLSRLPGGVELLADLFHMNIEEADIAASIRAAGMRVGHVHFADSNRRAAGFGHTDFAPAVAALHEVGYAGYLSAEVFPHPDSAAAARQTIEAFRSHPTSQGRD